MTAGPRGAGKDHEDTSWYGNSYNNARSWILDKCLTARVEGLPFKSRQISHVHELVHASLLCYFPLLPAQLSR
jgi:hypothetical protein